MYKRILVPLDGSDLAEQVLPYVRPLARATEAEIRLIRVVDTPINEVAFATHPQYYRGLMDAESKAASEYLAEQAQSLEKDGFLVSHGVVEGHPAPAIAGEADQKPDTLIAMSSHGRSGLSRWLLGSVTNQLILTSSHPLLLVRSQESEGAPAEVALEQILVPVDGSELAENILPLVTDLARAMELAVTLIRATPSRESYYRYGDQEVIEWEDLIAQVDADAAEYLHQTGQRMLRDGVPAVEERLLHGSPAEAIIDLAKATPANIIMMSTHGRSGMGRWVLGSIADRVIRHSGDPVLLVRASETSQAG